MGLDPKQRLLQELQQSLQGELYLDEVNKMLFATDASIYQQTPIAVARPKSRQDCITLVEFSQAYNIPVIPRAAGTSLAGQAVGKAIIIDTSRYLNKILHIDPESATAEVEAGVVLDHLSQASNKYGLKFAPDPSTKNRCNIAGVIGNNAWGAHAPLYGCTRDHTHSMEIIVAPGTSIHCKPMSMDELQHIKTAKGLETDIYKSVLGTIETHHASIFQRYQQAPGLIDNSGYALAKLALSQPWKQDGEQFNLSNLICGSEGTLGLIYKAKLKLSPTLPHQAMLCVSFRSLIDAMHGVKIACQHKAHAVELLDNFLLDLARRKFTNHISWLKNQPQAILLVEWCSHKRQDIEQKVQDLSLELKRMGLCQDIQILAPEWIESAWALRRAALGLLMGMDDRKKPVTFVEDSAVPVDSLPEFVAGIRQLMQAHQCQCVYYGSVSMGLIHIRPLLDLGDVEDRKKLELIAKAVMHLLQKHHGTMSAKHGDGRARSPFLSQLLGLEVNQAISEIKQCFDPNNLFNPHNITQPYNLTHNLRIPIYPDSFPENYPEKTSKQSAILAETYKCNGAAVCRKQSGQANTATTEAKATMCPSFMVTHEEVHLTRGRANVIRQVLISQVTGQQTSTNWTDVIMQSLDLCLACKGCRSECPAGVDMAKIKAMSLELIHTQTFIPFKVRLLKHMDKLTKLASYQPAFLRNLSQSLFSRLLQLDPQRPLPLIHNPTLSQWFAHTQHQFGKSDHSSHKHVIFLNDFTSEYFSVNAAQAAISLLQIAGFRVSLSPRLESVRALISQGLLTTAKQRLEKIIHWIRNNSDHDTLILGLEPSELLTFRDEATKLLHLNAGEAFFNQFLLFEELVQQNRAQFAKLPFRQSEADIALHVHCHQKSLSGTEAVTQTLSLLPGANIKLIPSGCCGMAGLFGYEKAHSEISRQIAELELMPYLRALPDKHIIVATGFSCQHQIKDILQSEALHPAQVLYNHINGNSD